MARTQRQTECIVMVKAGHECQPTVYMSSHGNLCYEGQLRGSVVLVKFLLVSVNMLSAEHETCNALVVVWENRAHS